MASATRFCVVIPARFGSTRLPGKPLLKIAGRPMIEHVWRRAVESGAQQVVVATDDERIRQAVEGFGGHAVMTSAEHASGTDRLAEVANTLGWSDDTIVVNLQGDEPMMPGQLIARMALALESHVEAGIATLAAPIVDAADISNPNVVKVVLDQRQFALYFSRAPIPWVRGNYAASVPVRELPTGVPLLRHFGLYGYRVAALKLLARSAVAPLEAAESLEQLRALYIGTRIFVEISTDDLGRGVDTAEDLAAVDKLMNAARG
jgi:3-deoxy-manno-octulosonate cytidylyltransferase (CMP-KDO synthetase)